MKKTTLFYIMVLMNKFMCCFKVDFLLLLVLRYTKRVCYCVYVSMFNLPLFICIFVLVSPAGFCSVLMGQIALCCCYFIVETGCLLVYNCQCRTKFGSHKR